MTGFTSRCLQGLVLLSIGAFLSCGGGGGSTPPAPPTIASLVAGASPLSAGRSTTLTAVFSGGAGIVDHGVGAIASGTPVAVTPDADTTYTLTVSNGGGTATKAVTVRVVALPAIASFTASKHLVTSGSATTLTAVFAHGTGSVDHGIGAVESGVGKATGLLAADADYTLTVTNEAGDAVTARTAVSTVAAPAIAAFSASKSPLTAGSGTTLSAVFAGGSGSVDHGIGPVASGTGIPTGTLQTDMTYRLTVTNAAGDAVTAQAVVEVVPAPTIASFTTARSSVTVGHAATLTAVFSHGAGTVDQGLGAVTSGIGLATGPLASATTFTLTVVNPAGDAVRSQVAVDTVPGAVIGAFTAGPANVRNGESTLLHFTFALGSGVIDPGLGPVQSGIDASVLLDRTTDYRLTVTNAAGDSVTALARATMLPGSFTPGPPMLLPRHGHRATLLPDGRVLLASGARSIPGVPSAEFYDPATGRFSATSNETILSSDRTATLLPGGTVLLTGGFDGTKASGMVRAERFDPRTGLFTLTGAMATPRYGHTATLLPDGKVLVAGGVTGLGATDDAEIYDPATGAFTAAGTMPEARFYHTATLLPSGSVLVAGGENQTGSLVSACLFDPATGQFTPTGSMHSGRGQHGAALLQEGKVLVAGGYDYYAYAAIPGCEIYDPAAGTFTVTGPLPVSASDLTVTALPDGKVLMAGTYGDTCQLFDPSTGAWTITGHHKLPSGCFLAMHSATLLPSGKVLVAGGFDSGGGPISNTLLFDATDDGPGYPMAAYLPAALVLRAGTALTPLLPLGTGATTWTIDPPLPQGLALDPATGAISGTPAGAASARCHVVTAGNGTFSARTFLWITVLP